MNETGFPFPEQQDDGRERGGETLMMLLRGMMDGTLIKKHMEDKEPETAHKNGD